MKKGILTVLTSVMLGGISGHLHSAELDIVSRHGVNGDLRDGMKIATGRIICREVHTGFQVWMDISQSGNGLGHYIILGSRDDHHELRVRIEGEGWTPSVTGGREGVVSYSQNEQAVFDVVIDGDQRVVPDEYVYPITGRCF